MWEQETQEFSARVRNEQERELKYWKKDDELLTVVDVRAEIQNLGDSLTVGMKPHYILTMIRKRIGQLTIRLRVLEIEELEDEVDATMAGQHSEYRGLRAYHHLDDMEERSVGAAKSRDDIPIHRDDDVVVKGFTGPERANWRFLQLAGLGIAFVLLCWVSHVTAGVIGWTWWEFVFGWLTAASAILYPFVFLFHIGWYAYKRGGMWMED